MARRHRILYDLVRSAGRANERHEHESDQSPQVLRGRAGQPTLEGRPRVHDDPRADPLRRAEARQAARHRAARPRARHQRGSRPRGDQAPRGRGVPHLHPQRRGDRRFNRSQPLPRDGRGARRARGRGDGVRDAPSDARRPRRGAPHQRRHASQRRSSRPQPVHRDEPPVPRDAVLQVPERAHPRHGQPRMDPAGYRRGGRRSRSCPSGRSAVSPSTRP